MGVIKIFTLEFQDTKKPNRKGNSSSNSLKCLHNNSKSSLRDIENGSDNTGATDSNLAGATGVNTDTNSAGDS